MFLVKRGRHSAVCQLDLKGFDAELAVISGRASSVEFLTELIAKRGPAPEQWLSIFCDQYASRAPTGVDARTSSAAADRGRR
jgi:type IV secretory pathway VirB4 component